MIKAPGFNQWLAPIGQETETDPKPLTKAPGFDKIYGLPAPPEQPTSTDRAENYIAGSSLNDYLGRQQSPLDEFGNFVMQTGVEALAGTVEAASYLGDWEQFYNHITGEEDNYSNWLADEMKSIKEATKEEFPVYLQEENRGFKPSSFEWWMHHGGQGLGSTLSLLIPGLAVAKLGQVAGLGRLGQGIAAASVSRYAESTMEANQVFEEALRTGATRQKAAEAAHKTWNTNWLFALQDVYQFWGIAKGFNSMSKGLKGLGLGIVGQMATEGAEEAGQYIVSEEARRTATEANTEYFGAGFDKRLSDYIRDDEFKTSVLLGAVGGGVFTLAGAGVSQAFDVAQGDTLNKIGGRIQDTVRRVLKKELANGKGDKITSQAITHEALAQRFLDNFNNDRLINYKEQLEQEKISPDFPQDMRSVYDEHIQSIDDILTEQYRLRNDSSVPQELHKPILLNKLELAQLTNLAKQAEKELNDIYGNLPEKEQLDPQLIPLKKAHATMQAYSRLKFFTDQLGGDTDVNVKAEKAAIAYAEQRELIKQQIPNLDLDKSVKTEQDAKIIDLTFQNIATAEKRARLKDSIDSLLTKEGVEAYRQATTNKKINEESAAILTNPASTKEQLLQAEQNATDPELKVKLAQKYQELVEKDKQANLGMIQDIVDSTTEPSDLVPNDLDPNAIDVPDTQPGEFTPDDLEPDFDDFNMVDDLTPESTVTPEQANRWGLGKKETEELVSKIDIETRQPKAPVTEAKAEGIQVKESQKGLTSVSSTTINKPYFNRTTNQKVSASQIYATDDVTGRPLIDTPRIHEGMKVTLKLEKDFQWDQREKDKATYDEKNFTINIYVEGIQKPIAPLRSSDNKYMTEADKELNRNLRKLVYSSPTQSIETTLTGKSIGSPRTDSTLRTIQILESDFMLTQDGKWRMQRLPHNPVFGLIDQNGETHLNNIGSMRGIGLNTDVIDRIHTAIEIYRQRGDLAKMAGETVTFRTSPDGTFRIISLKYRQLTNTERGWVRNNLANLINNKDLTTLKEVIYIPQHPSGIYKHTDDKGRTKKPDVLRLDRFRFHLVNTSKTTSDFLIPIKGKNNQSLWIAIQNNNLSDFLNNRDFPYRIIDSKGNKSPMHKEGRERIVEVFDKLLVKQFKNLNEDHLNSEIQYTDPTNPEAPYPTFYEYLVKSETVSTNLKGEVTIGSGEDSSYSFDQVSIYLDPNPSQIEIKTTEEGDISNITDTSTPQPPPSTPTKKSLKDLADEEWGDETRLKPAVVEGYTFNVITERELQWLKDHIGEDHLVIAKNLDTFIVNNGVEAFGQYYNSLVTVAQLAPAGTAYHEAGHFLLDPKNGLISKLEKEKILDEGSKIFDIERGQAKPQTNKVEEQPQIELLIPQLEKEVVQANTEISKETNLTVDKEEELQIEEIETIPAEIEPAPTTTEGINNYYKTYNDYFNRRYTAQKYSGPKKKGELEELLNTTIRQLQMAHASIVNYNQNRSSVQYAKINIPGETIPITLRFLKNIKKNLNHSTSLDKSFQYKDATTKENEILNEFYNFIKYELDQFAQKTGKAVPKVIPNDRLAEKLDFWLNGKYGVQTYDAPQNSYPYGLSNIIKDIPGTTTGETDLDEERGVIPVYSIDPRTAHITGGEVFISDGLHFPNIASGHNKSLGKSGINSNTLGWYIDSEIEGDTFLYEFQSDIIPEVESGDFKFSIQKEIPTTEQDYHTFIVAFAGNTNRIEISKTASKAEIQVLLRSRINSLIANTAESIANKKINAERRMRGDDGPSSMLLRNQIHERVKEASQPSLIILKDYLEARNKYKFLLSILFKGAEGITSVDEESTIADVEGNILETIAKKLGRESFKPVYEYLRYHATVDNNTVNTITFGGEQLDTHKVNVAFNLLRNPGKRGFNQPAAKNTFEGKKPNVVDYYKAQNERKGKLIKQAISAQKKILSIKGKDTAARANPGLFNRYYEERSKYVKEFYINKYQEATADYIEATVLNLERNITEGIGTTETGTTLDIGSKSIGELQKDYEHWYKVMFEKFIKVAILKQKAKGKSWVYMPTYASMKAIEGSSTTGMIYATPHENREEKILKEVEEDNKFTTDNFKYSKEEILTSGNWKYYKKDKTVKGVGEGLSEIQEEEYQTALKKYVKGKSVGPFYAALSKIKGIKIVGLETPHWSTKPLLRVDISGYGETELERFKLPNEQDYNQTKSGDYQIEEKIMGEFEKYKLSDGKYKPKVAKAKGFFRRLLQMIKSILGFKSPLEKLFERFDRVKPSDIKIRSDLDIDEPRYKLLPGFRNAIQQKEVVQAFASEVMRYAWEVSRDESIDILNIFSSDQRRDAIFNKVKENFRRDFDRIQSSGSWETDEVDGKRYVGYIAMGIAQPDLTKQEVMQYVSAAGLGVYEDIIEGREGLNALEGFKTRVLKDLSRWGFRVKFPDGKIVEEQLIDEEQLEIEDDLYEDETGHIHGRDSLQVNPLRSLSAKVRLFLSTIPEPIIDNGKPTDKNEMSIFGTPKYIDFKRVYSTLQLQLSDSINVLARLEILSESSPIARVVLDRLMDEINKGNRQVLTDFLVKMRLDSYNKKSVLIESEKVYKEDFVPAYKGDKDHDIVETSKLIDTNRGSIHRTILNKWKEEAIRKRVIDTTGTVDEKMARSLPTEFTEFKTKFFAVKDVKNILPYTELKAKFISILKDLGVELPTQLFTEIEKKEKDSRRAKTAYSQIQNWMFGKEKKSLQVLFERYKEGEDPFKSSVLEELARKSAIYVENLSGGAYMNEMQKQEFPKNMPSYLTETINLGKSFPKDLLSKLQQDKRYDNNFFLGVINDINQREFLTLGFTSAIRKGEEDPKDFQKRSEIESFIMRFTAYHNNGTDATYGFFNIGTPADKTKQPMLRLLKRKGKAARDFLSTVLRNNIDYEAIRIQQLNKYLGLRQSLQDKVDQGVELSREDQRLYNHIQNNPLPTDVANLNKANKFIYIPELNDVPNLAEPISEGLIDPPQFAEARRAADKIIDKFINDKYEQFLQYLADNDLIKVKQGSDGRLEVANSQRIPNGVLNKADGTPNYKVGTFLEEFFYNDVAWRFEVSKVFQGDMALYKPRPGDVYPADDYFKRQYQLVTPGYIPVPELQTSVVRGIYGKQFKTNVEEYLLSLAKLINPKATKDSDTYRLVEKYAVVNKTDAQSLMTINSYRAVADSLSQWTPDHELIYNFAWKDGITVKKAINEALRSGAITEDQATTYRVKAGKLLLQPFKPFVYRDLEIKMPDGEIMMIKEQVKDSITVITPELAVTSKGYTDLLNYMYQNKIDIMSAEDTIKVGSYGVINDFSVPAQAWQKRETKIEDFKFPQFIPDKKKEEVSGTQGHKQIIGNIDEDNQYIVRGRRNHTSGKEMVKDYNNLWADKIKAGSDELKSKLGLTKEGLLLSDNPEKRKEQLLALHNVLQQELGEREVNENYHDLLNLFNKINGHIDFTIPISFPAFGPKFQSILTNLWKKNVIKQKSPGYSAVNLADFGVGYDDELKFLTNNNGEVTEAEIGLPIDYIKDIGLKPVAEYDPITGRIHWDKLNDNQKESLQFILYRIPTSNKSSMLPVRVVRVTPPHLNNIVMIPGELTIQQGLDFDVDKSQLIRRVLTKEGKIDDNSIDTKLFDLYWSILTSKHHIQEVLTPVDSPTMKDKLVSYESTGVISNRNKFHPLTPQGDVSKEVDNKDAQAEIGIAARASTAHAMLQIIKPYVGVQTEIKIKYKGKEAFTSIGDKFDADDNLISANHSESLQAAVDAAKDPLLAYFNVITNTMAAFHTLIEFGVPLGLAIDFFMQPVVKEWTKYYKHEGQSKKKAKDKLFLNYPGIKNLYEQMEQGRLSQDLTSDNLKTGLTTTLIDSDSHSARALLEFLRLLDLSDQMFNVTSALSVDTFSDATGLESLQVFLNRRDNATDRKASVYIDQRVFNLNEAPAESKRLAAFFKYGIEDAIEYISQLYPSASAQYGQARTELAEALGEDNITDKKLLKKFNQFADYHIINYDSTLFRALALNHPLYNIEPSLDKSYYRSRWSYFDPNTSIRTYINKLIEKYPKLGNNALIKNLEPEDYKAGEVITVGIRNTDAQFDKTDYINAWWTLLNHQIEEIRVLGHDLIRYSIETSGFVFSTKSFYDLIPIEYWVQSGVADLWDNITKNPKLDVDSLLANFIRHNFKNIDRFPDIYVKSVAGQLQSDSILEINTHNYTVVDYYGQEIRKTRITGFTLKDSYAESQERLPRFVRIENRDIEDYRLYESDPQNPRHFKEVQPLGGRSFIEVSAGRELSKHSKVATTYRGISPNPWKSIKREYSPALLSEAGVDKYVSVYLPDDTNSAKIVLENLLARETDTEAKKGIEELLKNVHKINTPVEISVDTKGSAAVFLAEETGEGVNTSIRIHPEIDLGSESEARHVILHELNHAFGSGVLTSPEGEQQVNFVRNITRLYEDVKKRSDLSSEYGLKNSHEFLAELASNPKFRKKLRRTDLWSRILRAFRKLLGMKDQYDKVLDQYYDVLDKAQDLQRNNTGEFAFEQKKKEEKKPGAKRTPILQQILNSMLARERELRRRWKKVEANELSDRRKTLEALSKTNRNLAMVQYLINTEQEVQELKEAYNTMAKDPSKVNKQALNSMRKQLMSYDIIPTLIDKLYSHPEEYVGEGGDVAKMLEQANRLRTDVSHLTASIKRLIIKREAHKTKELLNDPNITIDSLEDTITVADRDIPIVSAYGNPPMDVEDPYIKSGIIQFKQVDAAAHRRLQEDTYNTAPKEKEVVVVTLEPNTFGVGMHHKKRKVKYKSVGFLRALEDYEQWLRKSENRPKSDNFADKFAKVIDPKSKAENDDGVHLISPFSVEGKKILAIKEDSLDYPLRQFYESFVLEYLKDQEDIAQYSMRPGLRIPSIGRDLLEGFLREKGVKAQFGMFTEQILNNFRVRYDETDYKPTDQTGAAKNDVALRFVAKQDGQDGRLTTREVSLDIATTIAMFKHEMYLRNGLLDIQDDIEMTEALLAERRVLKTKRVEGKGLIPFVTRMRDNIPLESGEFDHIKGVESESYKLYHSMVQRHLYGHLKKDEGSVKVNSKFKLSIAKTADAFLRFTGLKLMIFNLAIPLANSAAFELSLIKEVVGGNIVNGSNWKYGQAMYWKEALPAVRDVLNRKKSTKFMRVLTYFNALDVERPIESIGIDSNWFRQALRKLPHVIVDTFEYKTAATAMGAVMHRFKVVGPDGKQHALYDGLEITEDGKVSLAKGYTYEGKNTLGPEVLDQVMQYTLRIYQSLTGVRNKMDTSRMSESIVGRMVSFMRNWLMPGLYARFKTQHFDEKIRQENEGHYVSSLILFNNIYGREGFVKNTLDSLKVMFWMEANDPKLLLLPNELEYSEEKQQEIINLRKANMRKTLFELYTIAALSMLLWFGWDDDEDDSYLRYMSARVRREIMTFIDPSTTWDVLRSPTVAISTIDGILRVKNSMFESFGSMIIGEDQPRYKSGPYEDQIKLGADLERLFIPFAKQFKELDQKSRIIERGGYK